jgi:hypothetical protein
MALQALTYAWGVAIIISAFVLIFGLLWIVFSKLRGDEVQTSKIYSFRLVGKTACWFLLISSALSGVIYISTESFDVAISVWAFLIACTFAGLLQSLLLEYHAKRRGAKKL